MLSLRARNIVITIFVIAWLLVFNYESIRYFYLNPFFGHQLPKVKFLFPPAGWVMFFNVGNGFGHAQVYGIKEGRTLALDPHEILPTRDIGYDNIHRNILTTVLLEGARADFCRYLRRKLSYFDGFVVTYVNYPDLVNKPHDFQQSVVYQCP